MIPESWGDTNTPAPPPPKIPAHIQPPPMVPVLAPLLETRMGHDHRA